MSLTTQTTFLDANSGALIRTRTTEASQSLIVHKYRQVRGEWVRYARFVEQSKR